MRTVVRLVLGAFAILIAVAGVRATLWRPYPAAASPAGQLPESDGFTRVSGVVHVHTALSDGSGSVDDVVREARLAGRSFVAVTDHNTLEAKPREGYRDGVLLLVGEEVSTDAGHLLALGVTDPPFRIPGEAGQALDDVRYLGGAAFAAHPWSPRDDLRWSGWQLAGPWGLEVMNLDSEWRRAPWWKLAWAAAAYPFAPQYAVLSMLSGEGMNLGEWDRLLATRQVPALVGSDAHGRIGLTTETGVPFPSYATLFQLASNHVVLKAPLQQDAAADATRIVDALRRGASYAVVDALAAADDFSFTIVANGQVATMGDAIAPDTRGRIRVGGHLPPQTRLTLRRDGQVLLEAGAALDVPLPGPGVYRVEGRLPGWDVPWILSNAIAVFDAAAQARRTQRGAWPAAAVAPAATELLDDFNGTSSFGASCDASSETTGVPIDVAGGEAGTGAGRLAFRLGAGTAEHPAACEFSSRRGWDLSGKRGLVFSVRASTPLRMWVQVRDENPAASPEGTETWLTSVRAMDGWQRVAVPFAALHTAMAASDGSLDLRRVRTLALVVDRGAVKVGTHGTIWIDNLGAY